jgi:hypothetical protein
VQAAAGQLAALPGARPCARARRRRPRRLHLARHPAELPPAGHGLLPPRRHGRAVNHDLCVRQGQLLSKGHAHGAEQGDCRRRGPGAARARGARADRVEGRSDAAARARSCVAMGRQGRGNVNARAGAQRRAVAVRLAARRRLAQRRARGSGRCCVSRLTGRLAAQTLRSWAHVLQVRRSLCQLGVLWLQAGMLLALE